MSAEVPAYIPEILKTPEAMPIDSLLKIYELSGRGEQLRENARLLIFDLKKGEVVQTVTQPLALTENAEAQDTASRTEEPKEVVAAETYTVYNTTEGLGEDIIGRVEPPDSEISDVSCFHLEKGIYVPSPRTPVFINSQDPAYMEGIQGYNVLSINRINIGDENITSRQEFYRYQKGLENIDIDNPFAIGPEKMKGIRFVEWPDGKLGIFTRPQGGANGRGQIAYVEVDTMSEITAAIPEAEIIPNVFVDEEWGGVNSPIILTNNEAGLIMHIARFNPESGKKDYYPAIAIFHRDSHTITDMEIIARTNDLPFKVTPKKDDLGEIIYPGGVIKETNGLITINGGAGDTVAPQLRNLYVGSFLRYLN